MMMMMWDFVCAETIAIVAVAIAAIDVVPVRGTSSVVVIGGGHNTRRMEVGLERRSQKVGANHMARRTAHISLRRR